MGKIITQEKVALMIQPQGKNLGVGTGLEPMSIDRHGMTGKTNNTIAGRGQIFGRDAWGRFRVKLTFKETPGGLNTGTIEYEKEQSIDFLEKRALDEQEFGVWEMYVPCGRLDNPVAWTNAGRLDYRGRVFVTSTSEGDAPVREASGQPVVNSVPVSWEYNITLLPLAITALTQTEVAEALNAIAVLTEANPGNCIAGYAGPDRIMYAAGAAESGAAAEVIYTRNGGSTWAATSAEPFDTDEDISDVVARITSGDSFRVATSRLTTDAAAAAEIAYADVEFGDEGTTVWTTVDVGSTNGDVITVMEWLFYNRMYAAAGAVGSEGEVWVSTDQAETWTQILDGTTVISAIEKGYGDDCMDVYIVGASNLIMRETNHTGTFETLVGPSGGGAFSAIAQANDGLLFAGNGQSLYVSTNKAKNAGGWSSVKDFGTGYTVKKIWLKEGDSNHIYVLLDHATAGQFWHSNDGGNTWVQVTGSANGGYNDGVESLEDHNLYHLVGDVVVTNGEIHKVSPSESGC